MLTIDQIGIILSLLVTILGWSITAYYQRQILDRQIAAEKEKEKRQLLYSLKSQQLAIVEEWVAKGYRLWHLWMNRPKPGVGYTEELRRQREEIDRQVISWAVTEYTTVETLAELVEPFEEFYADPPQQKPRGIRKLWARKEQSSRRLLTDADLEHSKFQDPGDLCLGEMLTKLVRAMPTGNPYYYDEHGDFESKSDIVFDTYYPEAIRRIKELRELAITQERPTRKT